MFKPVIFAGCIALALPAIGWAQPVQNDAAARQAERLIQEEQLRQEQRERERDIRRQQPDSLLDKMTKPVQPEIISGAEQCSQVNDVQFQGVTLLSKSAQQALFEPYLNRCLTLNEINQ